MEQLHLILLVSYGVLLTCASFPTYDQCRHNYNQLRRSYISPTQSASSYDFVIAGGGLAGLVLAARLSDDPTKTVLVLEAGPSGDEVADQINKPSLAYFQSLTNNETYDWLYKSTPQLNASGRVLTQPRGKVLGGSSAVNGMYLVRPSQLEVNAWHDLIAPFNASAADVWSQESFFSAMKNIETFTPPTNDLQQQVGIKYTQGSRGSSGKLQTSYPGYMPPPVARWLPALDSVGIPSNPDPDNGYNIGGFIASSTMNPSNWTRSYAKNAYIDTLPPRENLHIISGATVSRIVFANNDPSGNKVASAVEFSTGRNTETRTVQVSKEVILSGGAYGSPHILQVSGIGPPDVLQAAQVPVQLELFGVGQHLMDHVAIPVFFNTSLETAGTTYASGSDFSKTPIFASFVNNAVAYVNGSRLFDGEASFATFRSQIASDLDNSTATRVPSTYREVIEGYKAIHQATLEKIYPTGGILEIVLSANGAGSIAIQIALQQALSQGRMYITSPNIYDPPTIDPQYLSHPADIVVLRQGVKLVRIIASSPSFSSVLTAETVPGPQVQSDRDIENYIRNAAASEFHPGSTCAMLPREKGGVVDARFRVYGIKNVRVVDASVFPISFCAHLMAPTYALAEKAASLILGEWNPTSGNGGGDTPGNSTTITTSSAVVASPKKGLVWAVILFALFRVLD